jgi:hypothetical protein
MIANDFRNWCGDERFAKFVRTLQTTSKKKGRLTYAQEKTWNEFMAAKGLGIPCQFEAVCSALAESLAISHEIEMTAPDALDQFSARFKERLLRWAEQRKGVGLDLDASLAITCRHEDARSVRDAIQTTFFKDNDVHGRFLGANITGSVRSLPPDESVLGFAFIVSTGDAADCSALGWSIQPREQRAEPGPAPRWWQFWRR